MIVPPCAMIPSVLWRSRMTWSPGGSRPSKPSRKPTTSHPSFSAARTTPRRTAFKPGQSPPLVRTPIRRFILPTKLQRLERIHHAATGHPLIVNLPSRPDQLIALSETICAAKQNNNQMTRVDCCHLTLRHNLRFAVGRKDKALPGLGRLPRLHSINAIASEQLVCVAQNVVPLLPGVVEGNLTFLLRNVKAETGFVHDVTGQSRHV